MKKSFIFLTLSLISFVFFSCSSFQNSSSTAISLSLPSKTVRAITNGESGWTLKINLSGDYVNEKEYEYVIKGDSLGETQKFVIDNLTVGQNLTVDVNIYLDDVRKYKSQQEYSLTLEKEENVLDVILVRDIVNSNISIKTNVEIIASFVVNGETQIYSNLKSEIIQIPYSVEKLSFTYDDSQFEKGGWKLNGKDLVVGEFSNIANLSGFSISFVPKETDNVYIGSENLNVLSLSFTSFTGQKCYSEFKFYLIDDSSENSSNITN